MNKKEKRSFEYVLEQQDEFTIKQILNYAYHRLAKHEKSGLHGLVNLSEVQRLRAEFGIIKKLRK